MFTPFIIGKLIERKIAHTPKQAEKFIRDQNPLALKILEEVIRDKYVLLNRAPTLHRLSIQAFKVKLMPGKTIRIHPLVTPAFNADFDGDQMAVHLPLSEDAQREAKEIIAADMNVLKPASGDPVITHSQDMVVGVYYLTDESSHEHETTLSDIEHTYEQENTWHGIAGKFNDIDEVLKYYKSSDLHIKDRILFHDVKTNLPIFTTVGRVVFNSLLPEQVRFINHKVGKRELKKILDRIFDLYGRQTTVDTADKLKTRGFEFATHSSVTINIFDLQVPKEKEQLLADAGEQVNKIHNYWFK